MNSKRRVLLKSAFNLLETASDYVSRVLDEEQDCFDNIPDNLQSSEKYEKMEMAIDALESVIENIDYAKEGIEEASM